MDVISLGKATKAKKAIASLNARLGDDVTGEHATVKERIDALEAKDPKVTLYNRVSDIEANTHINLNKHNLQVNALLQKDQYRLTDLVFDDFADDSGIDPEQSSGYTFDAAGRKVTIAEGQAVAEVVTIPEALETMPYMVAVSQAANTQNEASYPVDLTAGEFLDTEIVDGKIQLKQVSAIDGGYSDDLIPTMTSDTTPSGVASASSSYGAKFHPWGAFNDISGDSSYSFCWEALGKTGWIAYEFSEAQQVEQYTIEAVNAADGGKRVPKDWTFEGYHEANGQWDILDTRAGVTDWLNGEKKTFTFSNSQAYNKYRLNVTANNGGPYLAIGEIEMMQSLMQGLFTPLGTYETPAIDLGDNVKRLYRVESLLHTMQGHSDDLTTADDRSRITSSGDYATTYANWKAFDNLPGQQNFNDSWEAKARTGWIAYEFPEDTMIGKYTIEAVQGNTEGPKRAPKAWTFEGTTDGTTWEVLDTQANVSNWTGGEKKEFIFDNPIAYKKYRLNVTENNGGVYLAIGEIEMMKPLGETTIDLFTATSTDGVSFNDYLPLNSDGTIASPNGRFVKIKAVLTGDGEMKETIVHDFAEEEGSTFQENEMVLFDGAAKLKTQHIAPMEVDTSFTGEGTLLRMTIDKSKFARVEKVEVENE